jgi:hypothetical protein
MQTNEENSFQASQTKTVKGEEVSDETIRYGISDCRTETGKRSTPRFYASNYVR